MYFGKSHMPYVLQGTGGNALFLCLMNDKLRWRLHLIDDNGEPVRVETNLPDWYNECSPVVSDKGGLITLSFIGAPVLEGTKERNGLYVFNLLTSRLTRVTDCSVGFVKDGLMVTSDWEGDVIVVDKEKTKQQIKVDGITHLYRICPMDSNKDVLLITADIGENLMSLQLNLKTKECFSITTQDGKPLYKFCENVAGSYLYAERNYGGGFEDRTIQAAASVISTPVTDLVQLEDIPVSVLVDPVDCLKQALPAAAEVAKDLLAYGGVTRPNIEGFLGSLEMAIMSAQALDIPIYCLRLMEIRGHFKETLSIDENVFSVLYNLIDSSRHLEKERFMSERDIQIKHAFAQIKAAGFPEEE